MAVDWPATYEVVISPSLAVFTAAFLA